MGVRPSTGLEPSKAVSAEAFDSVVAERDRAVHDRNLLAERVNALESENASIRGALNEVLGSRVWKLAEKGRAPLRAIRQRWPGAGQGTVSPATPTARTRRADTLGVRNVELGCGPNKREGFFGIDIADAPGVDLVLDIEKERLPFPDSSVDRIYSSHTFEHLEAPGSPIQTLREIMRIARHGAQVEIWTPHGRSNDALLFGHRVFYTESHWKHICFEFDDFYLGKGVPGRFLWRQTKYVLAPDILPRVHELKIPMDFALNHMSNVAVEFGVILEVDKTISKAPVPQFPVIELCDCFRNVVQTL